MASPVVYESCATLTWEIENFDLLLETVEEEKNFWSPVWKVELNGGNIWCLLCVSHMDSCIWLDMMQFQGVSVNVRCTASIISSCGEVPLKKLSDVTFSIETGAIFGDKKQSMLPNNTLTLRLRMLGDTMKNQELRICSVLHCIEYTWDIKNFNSSSSYNTFIEKANFLLILSLFAKSKGVNPMVAEIQENAFPYTGTCVSFVDCELSSTNGCELITKKTFQNSIFPYTKWICDIEKFPEKEWIDIQIRSIVSLHKVSQIVKNENASDALSGPSARADDLLLLYREGTLSDATLNTEGKSFSAHRSILAARSPVFRAMFEKDEMDECRSGIVDIEDLDSETVDRMLVYLYGEKLDDVQWEDALPLYYAADKYDVLSLKQRCVDILKDGLTVDNACDVLVLADRHSDEQLRKCVVDFLSDHREVFSSSKWEKLEESNPRLTTKIFREVYVKKGKVVSEDECEIHIVTHKNKPFRVSVNNVKYEFTNGLFQEIYFLLTFIPVLSLIGAPIGALFS